MTKAELKAVQTYWLLRLAYGFVLIVAGFDKMPFMHKITEWNHYVSPAITTALNMNPSFLVIVSGIAEMVVGALILTRTRLGAYIGIVYLAVIIANLLSMRTHFDIVVRDFLLIIGLISLVWLDKAQAEIGS